ncbi:unnamed protein product [Nesidiocoris tenuis]|uniref:Uncharacterized protein n=1 Tax=Nesidiocoris tenuis TaxID=355587 RepID=A0A6H5H2Z8_9HEMI|nr:unnamed protein product [Nesidiocoris tenuis]
MNRAVERAIKTECSQRRCRMRPCFTTNEKQERNWSAISRICPDWTCPTLLLQRNRRC